MRRVRCFPKWLSLVSGLVLAMGVAACGDDDGGDDDMPMIDASNPPPDAGPDAMPPMIDAGEPDGPVSTHAGAISITEVSVPQAASSGASVLVEFEEIGTGTQLLPAYYDIDDSGTVPVGCVVFVHDTEDTAPTLSDEGAVTITGTQSPLGTCDHDATTGSYLCLYGMHAIAANDSICEEGNAACPTLTNPGTAAVTLASGGFDAATQSQTGMYVNIVGGGFTTQGAFPVVAVVAPTTIVIANPLEAGGLQLADAAGAAVVISGAGPTPANRNFLDDGTAGALSITKEAGNNVEAFTITGEVKPAGEGLAFDSDADSPVAMPTDGSAAELHCMGDGNCGAAPLGGLPLTLINGTTTDTAIPGGFPAYYFPAPTDKYAEFLCTFPGIDVDVTIPAGAMEAILGNTTGFEHTPTRIQTRVFKMNGTIRTNEDGTNQTRVVSGHGIVGFTDVE